MEKELALALEYFPYAPYTIQREFVHELVKLTLHKASDGANVGIFESPTGTGKTSSLLCGALAWINCFDSEQENGILDINSQDQVFSSNEPDWVREARQSMPHPARRDPVLNLKLGRNKRKIAPKDVDQSILELLAMVRDDLEEDDDKGSINRPSRRVYYCSRTHSQLSQVMEELRRIIAKSHESSRPTVRAVSLGSRKSLCIHEPVRRLGTVDRINERCRELLGEDGCPYYNKDKLADMRKFVGQLDSVADIEELIKKGKDQCVCPYYGSKERSGAAEIIALPYNMILSRTIRDAFEIDLKDSLVIFDEAHNLVDFINEMNSCSITIQSLQLISDGLKRYSDRFNRRLASDNLTRLQQLLHVCVKMTEYLKTIDNDQVWMINQFVMACEIDHINILPIVEYTRATNLSFKLISYYDLVESRGDHLTLSTLERFLAALSLANADGRLIFHRGQIEEKSSIKYVALNPSLTIQEIADEAHSIVLAGGTMNPIDDVVLQLFPKQEVKTFQFGHLVPVENVLGLITASGPSGIPFKFVYTNQDDLQMFNDLGQVISNICHIVPDGVVVFFPSFQLLDHFNTVWGENIKRIKKTLFIESSGIIDLDKFLDRYAHDCHNGQGALLLAVMGGRLSEGMNFADRLARALLVVGLPFPNANLPEFDQRARHFVSLRNGDINVQNEFYENICMRIVNQTIGRAIRHKNDYAAILLLDSRYEQSRLRSKLSRWFQGSLHTPNGLDFPATFSYLAKVHAIIIVAI